MNYGLASGLAYRHDFKGAIAEKQRDELLFRQALNDAHQNAVEYSNALQVKNVMNPYDYGIVKSFAEGKIKDIGKFVSENPDYKYNPAKWSAFTAMSRELQDNEHVRRGTQIDNEFKAMNDFMKDPKNQEFMDTPEMHKNLLEWQNYTKTGSADGDTKNRKMFQFMLPTAHVDTEKIFMETGSKLQHDKFDNYAGYGGYKSYVSDERKFQAARNLLANAQTGKDIRYDFNNLDSTVREKKYGNNIELFAKQRLDPYVPKEERKVGHVSDSGGAGANSGNTDPYSALYLDPITQPTSNTLKTLLHVDGDRVYAGKGVYIPFTDQSGNTRYTKLDSIGDEFMTGTPITEKQILPNGQLGIKVQYKIPIDAANYSKGKELLDKGLIKNDNSFTMNPMSAFWDDENDLGEGNYANVVKMQDPESGKKYYTVTAYTPVNHNETMRHEYNKEINGQKDAAYGFGAPTQVPIYQDSHGKQYVIQGGQKVYGKYK